MPPHCKTFYAENRTVHFKDFYRYKLSLKKAVVVAQLAEWSLLTPEVPSWSSVLILSSCSLSTACLVKDENKEKETGNGPFINLLFESFAKGIHCGQMKVNYQFFPILMHIYGQNMAVITNPWFYGIGWLSYFLNLLLLFETKLYLYTQKCYTIHLRLATP